MDNFSKDTMIKAEGLDIGYKLHKKLTTIHSGLHFELFGGELTCILGPNGTGKSTLLRTLSASQPLLGGRLEIMGKSVSEYSEKELSHSIGIVLTEKTFAGGLTVRELVGLGRQPHTGFFGRLSKHDEDIITHALHETGILHKANEYTARLSDGERQKTMIAKALVQECPIIMLDEPTAFLDAMSKMEIMTLLHRLAHTENKAVIMSTHDIEQALVTADSLWLLTPDNGLTYGNTEDIILSGKMDLLFSNGNIRFDYLRGGFSPTIRGERYIAVYADNNVLKHWTMNLLHKHGFGCIDGHKGEDTTKLSALYVCSPRKFVLKYGEKHYNADSFSMLTNILAML